MKKAKQKGIWLSDEPVSIESVLVPPQSKSEEVRFLAVVMIEGKSEEEIHNLIKKEFKKMEYVCRTDVDNMFDFLDNTFRKYATPIV